MRILHTSDWHLGKRLFKLDRTQEHQFFLDWIIGTIKERNVDLLLIAGDIFDTPTPPHQSLEMFYEFLHRLSTETAAQTLVIAGNHDSGLLLEAPAKILRPHRVKVWGKLSKAVEDHWLKVEVRGQPLDICAIPFFRSYELLPDGSGDALDAFQKYLQKERTAPQLLMLHHLAGLAEAAGSEQVINLTGVSSIPLEMLQSFDYVALGHIHKPQSMGKKIRYSGSPLPMRFSELKYIKSVIMLDVSDGTIQQEVVPVPIFRKLLSLHLTLENWQKEIAALEKDQHELPPMVEIQISLAQPQIGLIDDIKFALSQKGYELLSYLPLYAGTERKDKKNSNLFKLTPLELFTEFYLQKYPDSKEIPQDLMEDFKALISKAGHASS